MSKIRSGEIIGDDEICSSAQYWFEVVDQNALQNFFDLRDVDPAEPLSKGHEKTLPWIEFPQDPEKTLPSMVIPMPETVRKAIADHEKLKAQRRKIGFVERFYNKHVAKFWFLLFVIWSLISYTFIRLYNSLHAD